MTRKISPFLWFDNQAEEAANFYVSVFKDAEILGVERYGEAGMEPAGEVTVVSFRLMDEEFAALNGGPMFRFNESVSFVIDCESQEEVDYYWEKLTEGGEPSACGWLKDKYGLSWQVTPRILLEMMRDEDREKANRVMQAMLQMGKIEIDKLEAAYAGR